MRVTALWQRSGAESGVFGVLGLASSGTSLRLHLLNQHPSVEEHDVRHKFASRLEGLADTDDEDADHIVGRGR
jgi:hypothetical protein